MRPAGVLIYKRVAETLAEEITNGQFEPGAQLPPEPELSTRFGINRHTLRRAISVLSDMGLVTVEHGRGTFVSTGAVSYPVGRRTRFTDIIARQNLTPASKLIRSAIVPAKAQLAIDLQIETNTPCLMIEMLRFASGVPVSLASHFFEEARFPALAAAIETEGSLTKALHACGISEYFRRTTRISTRNATMEEAKLLRQAPTKPVLVTETVNVDEAGKPVEHGLIRSAADRLQMVFET